MSDFENYSKYFPAVAEQLRIVKREGNNLCIEAQTKSFGRTFKVNMQTELRPPFGFVSDNVSSIGTSGHEEFLMEEISEGTQINYTYEVDFKNPILRIFGKILIGWYAMRFWKHAVIDKLKEMLEE
jgi:hypothetical protein